MEVALLICISWNDSRLLKPIHRGHNDVNFTTRIRIEEQTEFKCRFLQLTKGKADKNIPIELLNHL